MRPNDFSSRAAGALMEIQTYRGERAFAFVPNSLPPDEPFTEELQAQATRAVLAIGRLDGLAEALPNRRFLLHPFARREALASSRIEGTRADLAQLALFEASRDAEDFTPDIQEVVNYTKALEYGWEQLRHRDITLGLIREMHALLMNGVRGADKRPGEFRTIQKFIGRPGDTAATARFVPPPPGLVESLMGDLERYITNARHSLFDLAMIHYQFEVIHPFLDGNGRLGRLLITLALGK
jgi:Fic family protein